MKNTKSISKELKVDIYSDIACPWCYVGAKKFIHAKNTFLKDKPECKIIVNWHPYMIDPETNKLGEEYMAYNTRRWGGDGWTHSLRIAGKKAGCDFANWKIWPNTFFAHCLVTSASKLNKAEDVLEEIFRLCYEEGENVSDPNVLDVVAKKFKIGEDWKSDETQANVLKDDKIAKQKLGIEGVPYFIIAGNNVIEGAQDSSKFIDVFSIYLS